MALFGFGKDKQKDEANPVVMAYLEDAQMIKSPAMLLDAHKNEIPCSISAIQEDAGLLHLHLNANLFAEKGSKIHFILIMDNMRIMGASKINEVRPGNAVIDIPESFEIYERRKKQRAKINPREGTTCTLLTGLFDGIGITGLVENISETGARMKVENAIEIKTEKKFSISSRTLKVGQIFPIVKISKIPHCIVTIECGGKAVYTEATVGNFYIGLSFEEFKSEYARIIETFVSSRNSPPPTALPPRVRRQKESNLVDPGSKPTKETVATEESESTSKASPESKPSESKPSESKSKSSPESKPPESSENKAINAPSSKDVAPAESKPATANETTQTVAPVEETAPALKRPAPTPLQKLKRKARTVVLCGTDEKTLNPLEKIFHEEGYGKILRPQNLDELIESAPQGGTGIILLHLNMPVENCIAVASTILTHISDPIPLVVISENGQITVGATLDAQKAGISLLLTGPLKIDDALFNKVEELMGIG
ncbi:MAG: response regulator [Holophagales bacterium]|nr:response regulator [Holophagales bacterium]